MYLAQGTTCVAHNVSAANLLHAIDSSNRGTPLFIPASGAVVTRASHDTSTLTPRELEVLKRVTLRRQYAQIALELNIKVETVRKHTASIRAKLGADSLYDLIAARTGAPVVEAGHK
jgi:DNA-binding CsgD family transcriptional regulator